MLEVIEKEHKTNVIITKSEKILKIRFWTREEQTNFYISFDRFLHHFIVK